MKYESNKERELNDIKLFKQSKMSRDKILKDKQSVGLLDRYNSNNNQFKDKLYKDRTFEKLVCITKESNKDLSMNAIKAKAIFTIKDNILQEKLNKIDHKTRNEDDVRYTDKCSG